MKKKIIFVSDSIRIGGIQKSLINILKKIDYTKFEVFLFLFNDKNIELIDKRVNIIKPPSILKLIGVSSSEIKKSNVFLYIARCFLSLACKIFTSSVVFDFIYKRINFVGEYDIAISYSNNVNNRSIYYGYNKFTLEKVAAPIKMCWVHVDYLNKQYEKWEETEFNKFDKIILVSEHCKKTFEKKYPTLSNKTYVVYNYLYKNDIIKQSNCFIPKELIGGNILLSIGRLESLKNFEMQIKIANYLNKKKVEFKWYIIGEGNDEKRLKKMAKHYNLENDFLFLGNRDNVYPYIKKAKLLISTSLTESFGMTIAEALILNTPVVVLKYPAVSELITNNGIVCDNEIEMKNEIYALLTNKEKYKKLSEKTVYNIKDKLILKQLSDLLNGGD
ncbi:MAG: glycosyltransferase [Bacilli bacterium]